MKPLGEWLASLRATQEQNREVEYLLSRQEAIAREKALKAKTLRDAADFFGALTRFSVDGWVQLETVQKTLLELAGE